VTLLHGCALDERSSGGILTHRTSSFKCYVDHSHIVYSSGNIDVWNWVHLFESRSMLHSTFVCTFILLCFLRQVHSPFPKLLLHRVRSIASSFNFRYRLQDLKCYKTFCASIFCQNTAKSFLLPSIVTNIFELFVSSKSVTPNSALDEELSK